MREFSNRFCRVFGIFLVLGMTAHPASADNNLPAIEAMLKMAAQTDTVSHFKATLELALETWPNQRTKILTIADKIKAQWLLADYVEEIEEQRKLRAEKEAASRARGLMYYLDPALWNGKAELGAGSSTGDTEEQSLAAGLHFNRKFGSKWEHSVDMTFDYARSASTTTRQRFVSKFETIWRPWASSTFLLNYTELELDQFSGYDYRVVENLGVGFEIFQTERHKLRFEGGPGVRFSKLETESGLDTEYLGRLSGTYDLKITDNLSLKDKTSVIFASESTTLENFAQFSARINSSLAARVGFEIKYDSAAPENTSAWDTSTRATLVYGF